MEENSEKERLKLELKNLKEEYDKLNSVNQPIVYTNPPDKSFEKLIEKGSDIVAAYLQQQSEIEKVQAETDKYEIDKTFDFKENELKTRNSLVKRQLNQQTLIILGGIVITAILAFTNNLTDGFITIIAVIIGAAIKDNILDLVKDLTKTSNREDK